MPPRAFAVTLPIALAAWLAPFLGGCSGATESPRSDAASASAASSAGSVGIRYVTHRVHKAEDFKRISEYFTGEENHGGDVVLYTDSTDRRGLYFMVALDRIDTLPEPTLAVVEYVTADKAEPQKCLFVLPALTTPGAFRELRLGVTGGDWPHANPKVVAWKITLHAKKPGVVLPPGIGVKAGHGRGEKLAAIAEKLAAQTGPAITSAQSFLWALPEKK